MENPTEEEIKKTTEDENIYWDELLEYAATQINGVLSLAKIVDEYKVKIDLLPKQALENENLTFKYIGARNLMNTEIDFINKFGKDLEEFVASKEDKVVRTTISEYEEVDPDKDYMADIKEFYDYQHRIDVMTIRVFKLMSVIMVHIGTIVDPDSAKVKEINGYINMVIKNMGEQ